MSERPDYSPGLLDSAREIITSLDVGIIPTERRGKAPLIKDWPNRATKDLGVIAKWLEKWPGCNLGAIPGDRYLIIDVDPRNGGLLSAKRLARMLPITRTHQTGWGTQLDTPGSHLWYVIPEGVELPKQGGKIADGVDFKTGHGSQVLIPESITQRPYVLSRAMAPVELPAALLAEILGTPGRHPAHGSDGPRPQGLYGEPIPEGQRNIDLASFIGDTAGLVSRGILIEEAGRDLVRLRWEQQDGVDEGMSLERAMERFDHFRAKDLARDEDPKVKAEDPVLADGYLATPLGNVQRWLDLARGRARWVDAWKKWIVYYDGRWIVDLNAVLVQGIAKEAVVEMRKTGAPLPEKERLPIWKWATQSSGTAAIEAMPKLARDERDVWLDYRDIDAQPMLLNVENGTIDLTNRELLPHKPSNLLTMQAPVNYDPQAGCPHWDQAMTAWLPDPDVRWYMQKALGSGLSGRNVEHLFICYGAGRNGKSVMFDVIATVLGIGDEGYFVPVDNDLIVTSKHGPHTTAKMALYNKRTAVAQETDLGDVLNEREIKALTGNDVIEGRRLYENKISFRPTNTLFMLTNHKPRIRGIDDGIWRRVSLIPWTQQFQGDQAIERSVLVGQFATEASGILNWLLDGCEGWLEEGFSNIPPIMADMIQEYRENSDHIGRWITTWGITVDPGGQGMTPVGELKRAWEEWASVEAITKITWPNVRTRLCDMGAQESQPRIEKNGVKQRLRVMTGVLMTNPQHRA